MKKFVVYELYQHPDTDEVCAEKLAEFDDRPAAEDYAALLLVENLIIEEEHITNGRRRHGMQDAAILAPFLLNCED